MLNNSITLITELVPEGDINISLYRVTDESLQDFRTWQHNSQDRRGRKEHINR
jgi:hypothetical protein